MYVMWLDPKQIDKNKCTLLDLWARCVSDQKKSQETKRPEMKSKLVTQNVKDQVSNAAFKIFLFTELQMCHNLLMVYAVTQRKNKTETVQFKQPKIQDIVWSW